MIAGHEPSGQIVKCGPGTRRFKEGDRVVIYHISGCGLCNDCRRGYMISCTSEEYRKAYGWQRDGGMAPYIVAEEKDLVMLPDSLSYGDGAQVACGFGTVYEGIEKIGISGNDAVLITGLGPVGLAAAMLCRAMGASTIIGIEANDERVEIAKGLELRKDSGIKLFDTVLKAGPDNVAQVQALTGGMGCEKAIECSANANARLTAIQAARKWGKIVMIGEGGLMSSDLAPSPRYDPRPEDALRFLGHQHVAYGRIGLNVLVRWNIHPADLITHRFPLEQVPEAYALMNSGNCGKVAVCFDEELQK